MPVEKNTLYLSLQRNQREYLCLFHYKNLTTSPLPFCVQHNTGKKISCPSMGREDAFVQRHNGGHSAMEDSGSFNSGAAAEGTAGLTQKWHHDPCGPPERSDPSGSQFTS